MVHSESFFVDSIHINAKSYFEKCICPEEEETSSIDEDVGYVDGKSSTDQV